MARDGRLLVLEETVRGVLIGRLNRFLVELNIDGRTCLAHLRNTGRLEELRPGTELLCLPKHGGKAPFLLVGFVSNGGATLVDPVLQSLAFGEAASRGLLPWLGRWRVSKREVRVGESRIDYMIESRSSTGYLESKSAARLDGTHATYPDCPTDRGVRHIRLLGRLARRNRRCVILFIATHPDAESFSPDWYSDPRVGEALLEARARGAEVRSIKVVLEGESIRLSDPSLKVLLRRRMVDSRAD